MKFLGGNNSITAKLSRWENELRNDPDKCFLLAGISNGFRISDITRETRVIKAESENHLSTRKYANLVEEELKNQLELGCYMRASCSPLIISPLGAISKDDGKIRIIHDVIG